MYFHRVDAFYSTTQVLPILTVQHLTLNPLSCKYTMNDKLLEISYAMNRDEEHPSNFASSNDAMVCVYTEETFITSMTNIPSRIILI